VKSIGNDIVALNAIDIQRTNTPAFYLKILTPAEHGLYTPARNARLSFAHFVWLLWSVKESAYKYLKRIDNNLIFSPTKIEVQHTVHQTIYPPVLTAPVWENSNAADEYLYTGDVTHNTDKLYFRSYVTAEAIITVVNHTPAFDNVYWGYRLIDASDSNSQSKQVREFALTRLQTILKTENLQIQKDAAGVPCIVNDKIKMDLPISLAHHDHFIAYSFAI
jgi:phosphopantetheinyl transferase (holo-ACP synthase)